MTTSGWSYIFKRLQAIFLNFISMFSFSPAIYIKFFSFLYMLRPYRYLLCHMYSTCWTRYVEVWRLICVFTSTCIFSLTAAIRSELHPNSCRHFYAWRRYDFSSTTSTPAVTYVSVMVVAVAVTQLRSIIVGPIANLKDHYFQLSMSVCVSVCLSLTGTSTLQHWAILMKLGHKDPTLI